MTKLLMALLAALLFASPVAGVTAEGTAPADTKATQSIINFLNNTAAKLCNPFINGDNAATPQPGGSKATATPKPATAKPTAKATPKPATAAPEPTAKATPKPTAKPQPTQPAGQIDNLSYEKQVVTLVNQERAKNGLKPLTLSSKLSNVARAKSQDMHDKGYFSHTSPTYGSPFDMMRSFGISYRAAGENIAMGYGTPAAVMNGWMNSSGHRANILSANFTQIGVGYVADGHYWTQMFIG